MRVGEAHETADVHAVVVVVVVHLMKRCVIHPHPPKKNKIIIIKRKRIQKGKKRAHRQADTHVSIHGWRKLAADTRMK